MRGIFGKKFFPLAKSFTTPDFLPPSHTRFRREGSDSHERKGGRGMILYHTVPRCSKCRAKFSPDPKIFPVPKGRLRFQDSSRGNTVAVRHGAILQQKPNSRAAFPRFPNASDPEKGQFFETFRQSPPKPNPFNLEWVVTFRLQSCLTFDL